MATPSTNIHICHVNFSNDYQHVVYFENVTEQESYFHQRVLKSFYDYSQIRKNWTLKVNERVENAERWNYLFFVQGERTYYYFITNVEYVSDETVKLSLEMDVMQTYMWDYALQPCFVEREHSATDEIGDNVVDEGLDVGHYTVNREQTYVFNKCLMMMTTASLDDYKIANGKYINGVFSGCYIYRLDLDRVEEINDLFDRLNEDGKIDIILSMWMYATNLVETVESDKCYALVNDLSWDDVEYHVNVPSHIGTYYVPKNKKLMTYPYNYLYVTNHSGGCATYRWERFTNRESVFSVRGCIYPDGGIRFSPRNYNGSSFNHDEAINITGLPTCAWVSDTYKIWLAQNQNQHAMQYITAGTSIIGGVGMAIGGAFAGNPAMISGGAGSMSGGMTSVFNQLAQQMDMQVQPPQARGGISTSLNASMSLYLSFYTRSVTVAKAKQIDDFFTMYGYKTLRVKVPNRHVRERFTYTKTVNCLITGSFPTEDIRKIQSIYDNGVTFWYNTDNIGDYASSNAVLGGE